MTNPIRDILIVDDEEWILHAYNIANVIVTPGPTRGWSTACGRGYFADYRIHDGRLQLDTVWSLAPLADVAVTGQHFTEYEHRPGDHDQLPLCAYRCHCPVAITGEVKVGKPLNGHRQTLHLTSWRIINVKQGTMTGMRPLTWWEALIPTL